MHIGVDCYSRYESAFHHAYLDPHTTFATHIISIHSVKTPIPPENAFNALPFLKSPPQSVHLIPLQRQQQPLPTPIIPRPLHHPIHRPPHRAIHSVQEPSSTPPLPLPFPFPVIQPSIQPTIAPTSPVLPCR